MPKSWPLRNSSSKFFPLDHLQRSNPTARKFDGHKNPGRKLGSSTRSHTTTTTKAHALNHRKIVEIEKHTSKPNPNFR